MIKAGKYDAYVAHASADKVYPGTAILYIPDVHGIWQNSKLMADQFAANGFTTLIVDVFNGDKLPDPRPEGFDIMKWIQYGSGGEENPNPHTTECVDPIIEAGLKVLKENYGATKIGAVGYCFGAKYVARHYKHGISAGFVAHPSFVTEDELKGFKAPLSIAAAETDSIFPVELRYKSEEILRTSNQPWQINLFSSVAHGFAVRADLSDKIAKWAKEQAFLQAVTWFNQYLL